MQLTDFRPSDTLNPVYAAADALLDTVATYQRQEADSAGQDGVSALSIALQAVRARAEHRGLDHQAVMNATAHAAAAILLGLPDQVQREAWSHLGRLTDFCMRGEER